MLGEIIIGFISICIVIALITFLTQSGTAENNNRSRWARLLQYREMTKTNKPQPVVPKEVIMAMAQRRYYSMDVATAKPAVAICGEGGNGGVGEDEDRIWAKELLETVCEKLDAYEPDVAVLERIMDRFTERIEKIIAEYEANLCEYNNMLALISQARLAVEEEVFRKCDPGKKDDKKLAKSDEPCTRHKTPFPGSSYQCPVVTSSTDQEYLQTVYDQFVNERLMPQTFIDQEPCSRNKDNEQAHSPT